MTLSRPRLALLLLALLTLTGTGPAAGTASAALPAGREPYRPLPGDRPTFVTETDQAPPYKDCLWASAVMLLDKWTAGEVRVPRRELRKLSGDRDGGSTFKDLRKAFDRLDMPLTFSPDGGDFVTWPELLNRLARGGGAVLLGDYGKLPRRYGRWDPTFWGKTDELDNHAMYLDRYDRKRQRIWVMDPLGRGEWDGEWMPVSALKAYAWRTAGGGLWVAMTPASQPAPFAGVTLGAPVAAAAVDRLTVDWPVEQAPEGWTLPGVELRVRLVALESGAVTDPDGVVVVPSTTAVDVPLLPSELIAPASVAVSGPAPGDAAAPPGDPAALADPAPPPAPPPTEPVLAAVPGFVRATLPVPAEPGVHRLELSLVERRFGRTVGTAGPYTVFVPGGAREALIVARAVGSSKEISKEVGSLVEVAATVVNAGSFSWVDRPPDPAVPADAQPPRSTALWASWLAADPELIELAPPPVRLEALPLEPGGARAHWLTVAAPTTPGEWTLMLEVRERRETAFADAGSAPAFLPILVVPPPPPPAATVE